MVVMHQAMRRMVKTAQKFARRTAAAVKMQASSLLSYPPSPGYSGPLLCGL